MSRICFNSDHTKILSGNGIKLVTLGNKFDPRAIIYTFGKGPLHKATCKIW